MQESYDIANIGSGLGGVSAAIALRRSGHRVTIYERDDFGGVVVAALSCASNGARFFEEWDVEVSKANLVVLKDLIRHDWTTGDIFSTYPLGDYHQRFGTPRTGKTTCGAEGLASSD